MLPEHCAPITLRPPNIMPPDQNALEHYPPATMPQATVPRASIWEVVPSCCEKCCKWQFQICRVGKEGLSCPTNAPPPPPRCALHRMNSPVVGLLGCPYLAEIHFGWFGVHPNAAVAELQSHFEWFQHPENMRNWAFLPKSTSPCPVLHPYLGNEPYIGSCVQTVKPLGGNASKPADESSTVCDAMQGCPQTKARDW